MLLHIAILLQQLRIDPQALNWSESTNGKLMIWMLVVREELRVKELSSALEATDGIHKVAVTGGNPCPSHLPVPHLELPPDKLRSTHDNG